MEKTKTYQEWLNEEFAAVGAPPAGNVSGMGPVVPPTSASIGSGDVWPSLGAPSTSAPSKKICVVCKKSKKNCSCSNESSKKRSSKA